MAWRVNNINRVTAPFNRGVFSQDGYPAFTFKIIGIHRAFRGDFTLPKGTRLLKQCINEGCFAMVYMGYDGDISELAGHVLNQIGKERARIIQ